MVKLSVEELLGDELVETSHFIERFRVFQPTISDIFDTDVDISKVGDFFNSTSTEISTETSHGSGIF